MKKLPIGIQTFADLITGNYYYVDKTPLIAQLVETGKYYFLSRPRRFGKSLLVSTLKSAFAGEQELFDGLYLEKNWNWSIVYPVINISFGRGIIASRTELDQITFTMFDEIAARYELVLIQQNLANRFVELIQKLHSKFQQPVVVLVDEYDKPILDNIEKTEIALEIREGLKNIYSVIKDSDAYIKFALLTGVSKFSKVSLFSGLNNLKDISLDKRYATLCGYTLPEIQTVFADKIEGVDFEKLAQWYNGYNFLGEKIYNPFNVLLYLDSRVFKNYWFETGNTSFLLKVIREREFYLPDTENIVIGEADLSSFDINDFSLEALLFQTGYLTIDYIEEFGDDYFYHLTYPNREVKTSLNRHFLQDLTQSSPSHAAQNHRHLYKALESGDCEALKQGLEMLFAAIPNDWYRKNSMANYEGYYASIIYSCFYALGLKVIAEDVTNQGRIDLTVMLGANLYIIEFKVISDNKTGHALAQIKEKNYAQKYQNQNKNVFLVGVEFDKVQRNITQFDWENI
jgi:CO dehydrogenase/acetyl-CoA synthase epsilon subunit